MRRLTMLIAAACALWGGIAEAQMGPPRPGPRCLPGSYDGGQTEMAVNLELGADRRFRYQLSYGALDEAAEGTWEIDGGGDVLLTSDPVTPPAFTLVGSSPAKGRLAIALDVPRGISRQYFSAIVRFADGRSGVHQFAEEGLEISLEPGQKPVSVSVLLPVFDLESQAFAMSDPQGGNLRIGFSPNDLGRVAFARTPLRIDQEDLLLERHDRQIRFRRSREGCGGLVRDRADEAGDRQ